MWQLDKHSQAESVLYDCTHACHALKLHPLTCAVYLALSLPPIVFPTRLVLDAWLPGRVDRRPLLRKVLPACAMKLLCTEALASW